jgi:hypothetical protein
VFNGAVVLAPCLQSFLLGFSFPKQLIFFFLLFSCLVLVPCKGAERTGRWGGIWEMFMEQEGGAGGSVPSPRVSRRVNPCEQIPGHNEAYWGLEVAPESKTCLKHLVVQQPTLLCAGNRFTQHSKCLALGSTNILSVPTAICCFSLLDRCTY